MLIGCLNDSFMDEQVREMGEDVYTLFIHCILHTLYIDILEYDDWLRMDDNLFT